MPKLLQHLLKRLRSNKQPPSPQQMAQELEALRFRRERTHVNGERFFYVLRNIWGVLLAVALIASIVFQFWLAYEIGNNGLDFQGYELFLGIVAGESFVQVVGLSYIVVKCLFPENRR